MQPTAGSYGFHVELIPVDGHVKRRRGFHHRMGGHSEPMKASEVAALPIRAGAALRHARLFHPDGVLCNGTLTRRAATGEGLPIADGDVVGRLSKGAGMPGALPDFAGLAWRCRSEGSSEPWDVLMVSATARVLLHPSTSWSSAVFSTLMPYGYAGQTYWLRARMTSPTQVTGLAVEELRRLLREAPVVIEVEQASGGADFTPLAVIEFDAELETPSPDGDVNFDPTLNLPAGLSLRPGWLTRVRRRAYRSSRQGRDAE